MAGRVVRLVAVAWALLVAGTVGVGAAHAAGRLGSPGHQRDNETNADAQRPTHQAAPSRSSPRLVPPRRSVPVVYSTDLFHPHDDPDDHFDLATLFALPELDVRAILLDQGDKQQRKPGRIPLEQMFRLTGRRVPYATGLVRPLRSPQDTGEDQPPEAQGAVRLLLKVLAESREPVVVITTGSVRDVNAAFQRRPELFRSKVARLYLNIGNADGGNEWNVHLDRQAYVGLMRSGLPIYWCPCLPLESEGSTHWRFRQGEVLAAAPAGLQNFFIYALQVVRPDELDPLEALRQDLRPWRHLVWVMQRNMWCTASFLHAAGRQVERVDQTWVPVRSEQPGAESESVFTFVRARVDVDAAGRTRVDLSSDRPNMHVFRVTDRKHYGQAMKESLKDLFRRFPVGK